MAHRRFTIPQGTLDLLEDMSEDDLAIMATDESRWQPFINIDDTDEVSDARNQIESVRSHVQTMAADNLAREPDIKDLRNECQALRSELDKQQAVYDGLKARKAQLEESHDEKHLRRVLRSAKDEAEADSDRMAGGYDVNSKWELYKESRAVYRRRKIHEQRLLDILRDSNQ